METILETIKNFFSEVFTLENILDLKYTYLGTVDSLELKIVSLLLAVLAAAVFMVLLFEFMVDGKNRAFTSLLPIVTGIVAAALLWLTGHHIYTLTAEHTTGYGLTYVLIFGSAVVCLIYEFIFIGAIIVNVARSVARKIKQIYSYVVKSKVNAFCLA